jgi:hypothetical protein
VSARRHPRSAPARPRPAGRQATVERSQSRNASVSTHPSALVVLALAAVLVLAGTWAYAPSFDGVLVLDDVRAIARNATIQTLWPLSVPLSPPTACTVAGRPIPNLTFALTYAVARPGAREAFAATSAAPQPVPPGLVATNLWGYRLALPHLERALDAQGDDPGLLSRVAAMLAASLDPSVRDPARAVRLAERAVALTSRQEALALYVLALSQGPLEAMQRPPPRPARRCSGRGRKATRRWPQNWNSGLAAADGLHRQLPSTTRCCS